MSRAVEFQKVSRTHPEINQKESKFGCPFAGMFVNTSGRGGPRGFTLLELLFVILIIGIFVRMAWPLLQKTYNGFQLNTSARKVYSMFRYLQGTAVGESCVCCLNVSFDDNSFKASCWVEGGLQEINDTGFRRDFRLPQDVSMTIDPQRKTAVYFYPDGRIDRVNLTFIGSGQEQISLISEGLVCEIKTS